MLGVLAAITRNVKENLMEKLALNLDAVVPLSALKAF